jgi:hypothetical protein
MGCSHELTDRTIRATVRRQPLGMFWSIVGRVVLWILVNWHVIHCCCRRHHGQDQHQDHRESTLRGGGIGLSLPWRNGNCRNMNNGPWQWRFDAWTESIVAHFLIVAMRGSPMHKYRGHKQLHERATRYLWHSPPSPESIPYDWVEAEYLDLDRPAAFLAERRGEERDGRRRACP